MDEEAGLPHVLGEFRVLDFRQVPGLDERLSTLCSARQIRDPIWVERDIPQAEVLRFTRETGIRWSEHANHALDLERGQYPAAIQRGALRDLWNFFHRHDVGCANDHVVWVPIAEIHHPGNRKAEASFGFAQKKERGLTAEVRLFGTGGGGGASTTFEVIQGVRLTKPGCVVVTLPVNVHSEVRIVTVSRTEEPYLTSRIVSLIQSPFGTLPLTGLNDRCGTSLDVVRARNWTVVPIPLKGGVGYQDYSEKVGDGRGYNGSAGIDAGGLKATLSASTTWSKTLSWAYHLPLGRDYTAFRPGYATGLLWHRG